MPTFTDLAPAEIKVSKFNPARRTDRNQLSGLLISIQQVGILHPLDLASDNVLADGHRRLACAKILKLPTVPVAIHKESPLDAPALWVVLNSETMNLTPSQWLAAVDAGLPMETPGFPESLKRRITQLLEFVGKEGIHQLVDAGRSPHIMDVADRIVRYTDKRDDPVFAKMTVSWLLKSGNVFSARSAIAEEIPNDILIEAIEQSTELVRVWDVAK